MRTMIAIFLASISMAVNAHPGDADAEAQMPQTAYDCEHPPGDAVAQVPGLLGTAGHMVCLPAGPAITADRAWLWHYTGSFFDLPTIPAYAHVDSASSLPPFYFTDLSVQAFSGNDAAQRSEQLAQTVETYRPSGPLQSMEVVEATNNYGRSIKVYVAMESDANGWLVVCTPECQPNYVIVVKKRQRN